MATLADVTIEEIYREIDEKIAAEKPENLPENMRPRTEAEMEEYLKGVVEEQEKNGVWYTEDELREHLGLEKTAVASEKV